MKAVSVDTGGTFTDIVVFDYETGRYGVQKVSSTPGDPGQATINGLNELIERGELRPEEIASFSHGTTVGTNLLLTGNGAKVGLLLTEGFSGLNDIWHLPRFGPELCDIFVERTPPTPPELRKEVPERVEADGSVLKTLDEGAARQAIRTLRDRGAESIAVVFLFSFLDSANERRMGEIIAEEMSGAEVSLSSHILPQIREYPRLSTTIANARIAPIVRSYLRSLEQRLRALGIGGEQLYIMQSNGGVAKLSSVVPVATLLSGPCGGAAAGMRIAAAAGYPNAITLDMGGTSTDIALGENGEVLEHSPNRLGNWEIGVPMLMINTIGAGGGTISRFDSANILQVGPESAGADPGPVCYGHGGTEVTVTDANIVLGYLHPEHLLGGKVRVDRQRAVDAIEALGRRAGLSTLQMAEGIIRIINTKMEEGIRQVSTERGYDVRDFALVAFGGAGPVHAAALGADLGISTVIIPPAPGVSSALGLVMVDLRHDYVTSRIRPLIGLGLEELSGMLDGLTRQARAEFLADGFQDSELRVDYFLDLRYQGQGYELTIPLAPGAEITEAALADLRRSFDELHEQLYGHSAVNQPVEAVNYRARITVSVPKFTLEPEPLVGGLPASALAGTRQVCFSAARGYEPCPIYDRRRLQPGQQVRGPAIVDQFDSTTVILPGQTATVDGYRNLIIRSR